jgi:hypothetical protein
MFKMLVKKPSAHRVSAIILDAVEIEKEVSPTLFGCWPNIGV